jgi:dTDP-4-dehydrorhamnose 3,5-epimerase
VRFRPTRVEDAFIVELDRHVDDRGWFARTFGTEEFDDRGLNSHVAQCSLSFNPYKGTLRGMHFQREPHAEAKLVSCPRGAIYDVVLDLRESSTTYRAWHAVELTDDNDAHLYLPEGTAHGFQTLTDNACVQYQISTPYAPDHAAGVRWNDPAFGIAWPDAERVISERDRTFPDYLP